MTKQFTAEQVHALVELFSLYRWERIDGRVTAQPNPHYCTTNAPMLVENCKDGEYFYTVQIRNK